MKRTLLTLIGIIVLLSLQACAHPIFYRAKEFSGTVVDAETNKPLEGVVVVAQWILFEANFASGGHKGVIELHEDVTDKDGKYTIPGWGPKLRSPGTYLDNLDPQISFFKKGYWYHIVVNADKQFLYQHYSKGVGLDKISFEELDNATKMWGYSHYSNRSLRESVWDGRTVKLKKFVFGEEIKYTDANGKPATSKVTEENLDSMLSRVDTDIFSALEDQNPRKPGGIPLRRIRHLAKEWLNVSRELKKTRSLPDAIEKMLKEEYRDE